MARTNEFRILKVRALRGSTLFRDIFFLSNERCIGIAVERGEKNDELSTICDQ